MDQKSQGDQEIKQEANQEVDQASQGPGASLCLPKSNKFLLHKTMQNSREKTSLLRTY